MCRDIRTILPQIGNHSDKKTGAINPPIYMTTAYEHPGLGESSGYDYIRTASPTRDILQKAIADIEQGDFGFATSSGMAAIQLVIEGLLKANDRVVTLQDLYGGSYRYFNDCEEKGKYHFTYCISEEDLCYQINNDTQLVFIETPTNPMMMQLNIKKIASLAHQVGAYLVVDNTFYTPLLQQPLVEGADIVVHSATKYLSGHNDVLGGLVACRGTHIGERLAFQLNTTGATLSAFDCWLVIRGLKTLAIRLKQHEENAQYIKRYLESEPLVDQIYYSGHGGMITFSIQKVESIALFLSYLSLITFAESLGGVESLITYPKTQTHADIPEDTRLSYGLSDAIVRLSVGIEYKEDLVNDLKQAFDRIR